MDAFPLVGWTASALGRGIFPGESRPKAAHVTFFSFLSRAGAARVRTSKRFFLHL
jgi:hypothetical protein